MLIKVLHYFRLLIILSICILQYNETKFNSIGLSFRFEFTVNIQTDYMSYFL